VTRPRAVVLADDRDWRVGLAASVLMSSPIRAPLLYAHGPGDLPAATRNALSALAPTGSRPAGGAQVVRVGDVPELDGIRTTDLRGADAFALARAIDAFQAAARGTTSDRVVVVGADAPEYAMPAAAWAAKAGDPILFTNKDDVPHDTRAAIAAHQQPKIYVLGPESAVSEKALKQLRRLGTVSRISGADPAASSVAFARFVDGNFGWGVVDPGHGFVFASTKRPGDAGAAAPLSASGTYGPLLVTDDPATLPPALQGYLLDVQPGYTRDPVRGVYNHGWIVGDEGALSVDSQSRIDALLEIVPVNERASPSPTP
jgi:plastocyanin